MIFLIFWGRGLGYGLLCPWGLDLVEKLIAYGRIVSAREMPRVVRLHSVSSVEGRGGRARRLHGVSNSAYLVYLIADTPIVLKFLEQFRWA